MYYVHHCTVDVHDTVIRFNPLLQHHHVAKMNMSMILLISFNTFIPLSILFACGVTRIICPRLIKCTLGRVVLTFNFTSDPRLNHMLTGASHTQIALIFVISFECFCPCDMALPLK